MKFIASYEPPSWTSRLYSANFRVEALLTGTSSCFRIAEPTDTIDRNYQTFAIMLVEFGSNVRDSYGEICGTASWHFNVIIFCMENSS